MTDETWTSIEENDQGGARRIQVCDLIKLGVIIPEFTCHHLFRNYLSGNLNLSFQNLNAT